MELLLRSQRYNQIVRPMGRWALLALIEMSFIRFLYFFMNREQFDLVSHRDLAHAFFVGLRFDLLVLGFAALPLTLVALLFVVVFNVDAKKIFFISKIYIAICWTLIVVFSFVSLHHFSLSGEYYSLVKKGAFFVTPTWGMTSEILMSLIFLSLYWGLIQHLIRTPWESIEPIKPWRHKRAEIIFHLFFPIFAAALSARGTMAPHHLEKSDSEISAWPIVNNLALNAIWTVDKE